MSAVEELFSGLSGLVQALGATVFVVGSVMLGLSVLDGAPGEGKARAVTVMASGSVIFAVGQMLAPGRYYDLGWAS